MDLYADQIIDHSKHPRHAGSIDGASVQHEEANMSCGDTVKIGVKIENGTIIDIGWTGTGCAISQASMSLLAENVMGMAVADTVALSKDDALDLLGVPVSERRLKCALLGLHTLKNALRIHEGLPVQSWAKTVAEPPAA